MPDRLPQPPSRRTVLAGSALALTMAAPGLVRAQAAEPVNVAIIGDGRVGLWASVRALGDVEQRLKAKVGWQPGFTASLPVMEAVRAGSIDFSFATSTAIVNAIGANVPIVPLAAFALPSTTIDGLVAVDAPIRTAADLKGKRVAYQNGTTGLYSVLKYLETAGLKLRDVQGVSLNASEGFTALSRGDVDAWFHWQPAATLGLERLGPRVRALTDVPTFDYGFYIARSAYAYRHLDVAARLVRLIRDTQRAINDDPTKTVALWASQGGFQAGGSEEKVYETLVAARRLSESTATELRPVDEAAAKATQEMADSFHELGVLPRRVRVAEFLLSKGQAATAAASAVASALEA